MTIVIVSALLSCCSASIPLRIVNPIDSNAEWIEADGLGGFASGTVSGVSTRRYGHILEICDAEPPHTPRGCLFQAWSLSELLRLERTVLAQGSRQARND